MRLYKIYNAYSWFFFGLATKFCISRICAECKNDSRCFLDKSLQKKFFIQINLTLNQISPQITSENFMFPW